MSSDNTQKGDDIAVFLIDAPGREDLARVEWFGPLLFEMLGKFAHPHAGIPA